MYTAYSVYIYIYNGYYIYIHIVYIYIYIYTHTLQWLWYVTLFTILLCSKGNGVLVRGYRQCMTPWNQQSADSDGSCTWVWNAWGIYQLSLIIRSLCYFVNLKRSHWQLFLKPMSILLLVVHIWFWSTSHGLLSKKNIHIASKLGFPGIFRPSPHCERIPNQGVLEADSMAGPTLMAVTACTDWWFQLLPSSIHFHDPQMSSIYTN